MGIFVIVYKMKHSSVMTEMIVLTLPELGRQYEGKRQPRAVNITWRWGGDDNLKLNEIV